MHEFSLAQSVADLVIDSARREGISRVHKVTVRIGEWSHVQPDALTTSFEAIARTSGELLRQARLVIEQVPVTGECDACGHRFRASESGLICPACGAGARLTSGTELQVDSYEGE